MAEPPKGPKGEELRLDPADGKLYSKKSFVQVYGGTKEWDEAKPKAPPKPAPAKPVESEELRIDKNDGQLYSKSSFVYVYGGTAEWDAAEPEKRLDKTDGLYYTKEDFIEQYGGTIEWEAANPTRLAIQQQQAAAQGPDWSSLSEQEKAVYVETLKAQQMMQAQQAQFFEQMDVEEAMRGQETAQQAKAKKECRFVDDFRPSSLCWHLKEQGYCASGEDCPFGHSYEELHPISPDFPDVTAPGVERVDYNQDWKKPELRMKKKKNLCKQFEAGKCMLGKVCSFAHGEGEVGTVGLSIVGHVKTILCQNYMDGKCKFGVNCERAHHEKEIGTKRPPPELMMTSASKRPKHLPLFKSQLKHLTPQQRREYDEHLANLEDVRRQTRFHNNLGGSGIQDYD
eukprot:gnl/MRDRNA2_/MRDRNA2_154403_c0_seq1.p1 gnl/MRDRNA2_/MRDRNA2_154403_c0~~gnl/MRDRNA2_/MRDRNA2_154403_c0_seq1.p1  ORF type:complete len:397 (-),score=100.53 gnl/MRDRNA2_/MRDRNA2_154403_c0_seq1:33-1223(-)